MSPIMSLRPEHEPDHESLGKPEEHGAARAAQDLDELARGGKPG